MNHGSQYLGDMVPPSEMGLCAFGHRGLHENIRRATTFSAQVLDPFPRVMTKYQNINKEIQNAKEQGHFWKMDHLQAALANEVLMTHEERTLVQRGGDTHHNVQPKMTSTNVPRKRAHSRWSCSCIRSCDAMLVGEFCTAARYCPHSFYLRKHQNARTTKSTRRRRIPPSAHSC